MTLWRHWIAGQLDASIAAGLLLAIALLARHRLSPRVRSVVLLVALVRLVLPPWIRSPWPAVLADVAPLDETRTMVAAWLQGDTAFYPFAITSVVSVLLLGRLAWRLFTSERRWLSDTVPGPEWVQEQARVVSPAAPEVRLSPQGEGPLALGLRRRMIVLPTAAISQLSPAALEAVIAHEVAHHARRDLAWIAVASALTAIAWFNPLTHLVARALMATREDGSDDWAVQRTSHDPFAYAQALLQSARMVAMPASLVVAGAHPMGRRFRRLLDANATREGTVGAGGLAAIVMALALGIPAARFPDTTDDGVRHVVVVRQVRP